jgi:alkaline phosphatase D
MPFVVRAPDAARASFDGVSTRCDDHITAASPAVATEFVTPAITTGGDGTPYGPYYSPMIPFNPHIKYYEGDKHGYFKATVTPRKTRLDLRFVTSVEDPNGVGYTERSFVDGRPAIQMS